MSGVHPMHPWTLYALEVSRDREREIRNRLLLAEAPDDRHEPSVAPAAHAVALAARALSRGSRPPFAGSTTASPTTSAGRWPLRAVAFPTREAPMDEATAAVSWGPDRIDLFWVDAAGALVHRASRRRRWDAPESLGGTLASRTGRDGLGRRSAPGLRRVPRRRSCGTATGTARRGTRGSRSAVSCTAPRRHRRGAPIGSTSGRPARTARPGTAGGTGRAGSSGSGSPE